MRIYNIIKKRLASLPQYKIVRYHKNGIDYYLIKERTGFFSFDYIMQNREIGVDTVTYRVYFSNMDDAADFINRRIDKREYDRIVTETVKEI